LFHWTTEQGTKLLPLTFKFNVTATVPAVALAGESELTIGIGSEPGVVVGKLQALDVAADGILTTEINPVVNSEVVSVAGNTAMRCAGSGGVLLAGSAGLNGT
jgi:hypothetical protein